MQGRIRRLVAMTAAALMLVGTGTALADGTAVTGGPSGTTTDATPTVTVTGAPGARVAGSLVPAGPPTRSSRTPTCASSAFRSPAPGATP